MKTNGVRVDPGTVNAVNCWGEMRGIHGFVAPQPNGKHSHFSSTATCRFMPLSNIRMQDPDISEESIRL